MFERQQIRKRLPQPQPAQQVISDKGFSRADQIVRRSYSSSNYPEALPCGVELADYVIALLSLVRHERLQVAHLAHRVVIGTCSLSVLGKQLEGA